ncbi:hypothetical protein BFP97_14640 [Roseivirga sp. 4D4]|nr:hypothetical protein BFP97_14640 [Roseivirga sp. 4D4]
MGCNPDKQTKVDKDKIVFTTDDASRLFFKNVRRIYYELEVMEAAKLDIYRHKQRDLSTEAPVINLAIVDNWRYDEAYLLLEPNEVIGKQNELTVQWELGEENGEIIYTPGNKTTQVAFTDKLYDRLQQGCRFKLQINNNWVSFLDSDKSREAFRVTMFDYYRLVKRI